MDLGNLVKSILHHLLIGGMTCLDRRDQFPMVCALVYVMHKWTKPMLNHDARLSILKIYLATILHRLSTLKRY